MNYIYHGEFEKAVDDLHRYFDYAILSVTQIPDRNLGPEEAISMNRNSNLRIIECVRREKKENQKIFQYIFFGYLC